jgi:phage-related protein (TIGR01555 family)
MTIKKLVKDSWTNLLTGLGKRNTDKTLSTTFGDFELLEDQSLSNLYDGEGLGAQIIDIPANDMTRAGWTIQGDEDEKIQDELKRLLAVKSLNTALKYARLYRGSIIVLVTEKGILEEPLNKNSGQIKQLKVYSAARIEISSTDIITDENSLYFEGVEFYRVRLRNGDYKDIHASRCLKFNGELTADFGDLDFKYKYWGFSALQRVWERLKNYGSVEQSVANLMLEFVIGKYKFANLGKLLASGSQEDLNKVYTKMEIINASKSTINGVMLGEGEDYTRDSANVSGMADLIDRAMMNLSAVTGIPVSKLFGRSAAGMNATGEGDRANYYDDASAKQEVWLGPELQKLVNYIATYVYGVSIKDDKQYLVVFNSLWEPTEKERAEIDQMNAETHASDIDRGVITEDESRMMRYSHLDNTGE